MEQRELLQKHLVDIFGTPSVVSEVMSGKRGFNKEHQATGCAIPSVA
jgi:antitoxin component HigA of HigAB toxin-antitoxin module